MTSHDNPLHYAAENAPRIDIIYDGECPVCKTYVKHMRLKQNFAQVHLIDARKDVPLARHYRDKGMSLDEGMVVRIEQQEYYAGDAVNVIALLGSSSGLFNRLNAIMFRHVWMSRLLYPVMRGGRAVLLKLLGKRKIDDDTR